MKNYRDYNDGTYENYLAYHHTAKVTTLKGIKVNGHKAQQMDFYKAEHPDGTIRYFIAIVFRGPVDAYHNTRVWLEDRYNVTKEEGNQIYIEAKNRREYNNEAITTY